MFTMKAEDKTKYKLKKKKKNQQNKKLIPMKMNELKVIFALSFDLCFLISLSKVNIHATCTVIILCIFNIRNCRFASVDSQQLC